jgi:2',3'-cyclic-nucleotide 2'-phosphodiesterase (5'-nucleotidase family)
MLQHPYKIVEFNGVKVGVFGLVSEASFIFMPFWTRDHYFFGREVETARKLAHFLKHDKGADIVIALTHIGQARDTLLIDSVPDIDVIVGGFDGRGMREAYESPYTHGIVVRTYERLTSIGRLDLFYDRKDKTIVDYKWNAISLSLEEVGEE